MEKVSVVTTVLNEESVIEKLLASLFNQSRQPDEIIVIDAGSNDRTVEKIRALQKDSKNLRLLVVPGANRARGRNIGIARAHGPFIAVTDAGCIPTKDWLKKLIVPFRNSKVDVVSGYYLPQGKSVFQKCLAVYTCVLPHRFDPRTFLPASRSIAFRKTVWKKAGGYPKQLTTCEDLLFVERLMKKGAKFTIAKDAIVHWRQQRSVGKAFRQLFNYAKGDVNARYRPHVIRIGLVWLRYLVGLWLLKVFPLLLIFLVPQYFAWVIGKGYAFVKDKRALLLLPFLQMTADVAVMSGSLVGILSSFTQSKR